MVDEQDKQDQPYVDPNSGLATQPGGYAHALGVTDDGGEEVEDPNPDPGDSLYLDSEGVIQSGDDGEKAEPDYDNEAAPDEARTSSEVENKENGSYADTDLGVDPASTPQAQAALEHQAAGDAVGPGEPAPAQEPVELQDGKVVEGEGLEESGVGSDGTSGTGEVEKTDEPSQQKAEADAAAAQPLDGTSPDEAADANPGTDTQEQNLVQEPHKGASRADWVEFARTQGASESELAPTEDGGLKRDELAEKYGTKS